MIETSRLFIEKFTEQYLTDIYVSWLNDPEVVAQSRQRHHCHTMDECYQYYKSLSESDHLFLAILDKLQDNKHIGNVTVTIDSVNKVADIAVLIGDRTTRGKGYGKELWVALCHYLFRSEKMRKVTGGCYSTHTVMQRIMEESGMVLDGVRNAQVCINGEIADVVHYALFNEEMIRG